MTQYIDLTPTWSALLPILLELAQSKNQKAAREELERMAKAADHWVAHCKETSK